MTQSDAALLRQEYEDRMQRGLDMLWEREQTGSMDEEYDRWLAHWERLDEQYRALCDRAVDAAS